MLILLYSIFLLAESVYFCEKYNLMSRRIIQFNPDSPVPKYRQIIDSVYQAVDRKLLKKGDKIPSINQVCADFDLSRDTVMLAFNELKAKGVIFSHPGKGYYVASNEVQVEERIFLLFDELNSFKEDLYNSFVSNLNSKASVDIYFHHFNYQVFKNLILESAGNYTSYVIMPATFDNVGHLVQKLPRDRVYILDRLKQELLDFPVIYQDFEQDVYDALRMAVDKLKKYRTLVFVNPGGKEPMERVYGFKRFCQQYQFDFRVVRSLADWTPGLYEAYFVPSDRTLVELVKLAMENQFELGEKFGIVSFNDSMLKEVVAGGITTISTDFVEMGRKLSEMVLHHRHSQVRNPSRIVFRSSL